MKVAIFSLICKFLSPTEFPVYKGFSLRGAFGSSLKSVCCSSPSQDRCFQCIIKEHCAYFKIFESQLNIDKLGKDIPRGFVLEPPYDNKTLYEAGDEIVFKIILFGWICKYLPFFILSFEKIGSRGIGIPGKRGRFLLLHVMDFDDRKIYSNGHFLIDNWDSLFVPVTTLTKEAVSEVKIKFVSPVRIKEQGQLVNEQRFSVYYLLKAIYRRVKLLDKFYGVGWNLGFSDIEEDIENVGEIIDSNYILNWKDLERYSSRQKVRMRLGGLLGKIEVVFKSYSKSIYQLLKIGEFIHVGKNTTFGLGKIEIIE